jgi:hypothetical protein
MVRTLQLMKRILLLGIRVECNLQKKNEKKQSMYIMSFDDMFVVCRLYFFAAACLI